MTNRFDAFVNNSLSSVLSVLCMRSPAATTETRQTRRSDDVKSLVRMYYDAVMREIYVRYCGRPAPLVRPVHCILVVFLTLQTDNIETTKSQASSRPYYQNHCIILAQLIPVLCSFTCITSFLLFY